MHSQLDAKPRSLAIVLHDVAPASWPSCKRLVAMLMQLDAAIPLTLLVVPKFHHGAAIADDREWRAWIDARLAHGDELALHGWSHLDEAAPPRTPAAWFARRVMTDGEAEFAALPAAEARRRVELGLESFRQCGWRAAGFVPPAWQIGAAAHGALKEFPFAYTSSLNAIEPLPEGPRWPVPCLGFSSRSALRRWLSIHWNRQRLADLQHTRFIRIALHPIDAEYADTLNAWRQLLEILLRERRAVTKGELVRELTTMAERRAAT